MTAQSVQDMIIILFPVPWFMSITPTVVVSAGMYDDGVVALDN